MENQLVVFDLADEHYGVNIAAVEGIIKMQPITAVPRAPQFVEGVTNLRGTVLPVIDLRKRFGLPAEDATRETRIVVVEVDGTTVGMVVDAVTEVLRVTEEDIEPPSPLVTTVDSAFITGIAKVNGHGSDSAEGRLVILLDLGKVLTTEEKADLESLPAVA
jgi:purine-binding chemotaxis protein CheW